MSQTSAKVRQYAIAEELGISRSTVSKVFSNRQDVSEEMRDRVFDAAKSLGYSHKTPSEHSRTSSCPTIGALVRVGAEAPTGYRADYLHALCSHAVQVDVDLNLHFVPHEISAEDFFCQQRLQPPMLRSRRLDGLLLTGPWEEEGLVLASAICPVAAVTFGSQHGSIDTVEPDTLSAMRMVIEHLKALGHRRIAFVGLCPQLYWTTERYAGFLAAAVSNGLELRPDSTVCVDAELLTNPNNDSAWASCIKHVNKLVTKLGYSALVCCSDWAGFHVHAGIKKLGLSIPNEVSVTGFDDSEILTWGCSDLSSVHIPREMLVKQALQQLLQRLIDPNLSAKRSLYPCKFVDNASTGPA